MRKNECAVYDLDYLKYAIGHIGQETSILVTEKESGNQHSFKTKTEFYGHYKKKNGGWLADYNKKHKKELQPEDFIIEDVVEPKPKSLVINAVNEHIARVNHTLGVSQYYGYIGRGDSWRLDASTILEYKGSTARKAQGKPYHMQTIEEHLIKRHGAEVVTGLEVDDVVVMDCTANPDLILVGVDKDYNGCALRLFNPDTMGEPQKISGFGRLYIASDKTVKGYGRIWLYHQVLSGDGVDNYFANSASDIKWAEKSSFALLNKCSNDKQAFEALIEGYKKLYPEKKTIKGWRGDDIEIDWLYVMQENFTMAHMLRWEGDQFNVVKVLNKLGVNYEL